jgi:hypothetical protein
LEIGLFITGMEKTNNRCNTNTYSYYSDSTGISSRREQCFGKENILFTILRLERPRREAVGDAGQAEDRPIRKAEWHQVGNGRNLLAVGFVLTRVAIINMKTDGSYVCMDWQSWQLFTERKRLKSPLQRHIEVSE